MKYLILHENSIAKAKEISAKIWNMVVPDTSDRVTKHYTGWVVHPTDGRVALQVLGEAVQQEIDGETVTTFTDALSIHPHANEDVLVDALGDAVTANERASMKGKLASAKGGSASLLGFAMSTPSLNQRLKTHEQMKADGWLGTSQTLTSSTKPVNKGK